MSNNVTAIKDRVASIKKTEQTTNKRRAQPALEGNYAAYVDSAQPTTFKSGAFGIKFTYGLEGTGVEGRKVFENTVLVNAAGETNEVGVKILKARLQAFGLTTNEINNEFEYPENENHPGSLPQLNGAKVILTLVPNTVAGVTYTNVKFAKARA